jgi:hypothetical protein
MYLNIGGVEFLEATLMCVAGLLFLFVSQFVLRKSFSSDSNKINYWNQIYKDNELIEKSWDTGSNQLDEYGNKKEASDLSKKINSAIILANRRMLAPHDEDVARSVRNGSKSQMHSKS